MPLEERQRLVSAYRAAVRAYYEASTGFDEAAFRNSLQRMELARNEAETARAALLKHEHLDSVFNQAPAKTQRPSVVVTGSTVALFNVNTERWVLFELAECGPPPDGAMAYAARPDHQKGDWIVGTEEMRESERLNAKLYYTEAGLTVLREAGLEM